jgi:hypothetical protein
MRGRTKASADAAGPGPIEPGLGAIEPRLVRSDDGVVRLNQAFSRRDLGQNALRRGQERTSLAFPQSNEGQV